MSPPPPRHQLKADEIWAVESELFDSKVLRLAVENCDAAVVIARLLCHHHLKAASLPRVNYFCELPQLGKSTINPSLCHPAKCQVQTPVSDVLGVELP